MRDVRDGVFGSLRLDGSSRAIRTLLIIAMPTIHVRALLAALTIHGALAIAPAPSRAQTGRVDGVVYDSLRKQPLAGAIVQVAKAPPDHGAYSATTDSLGRFSMPEVRSGAYVVGIIDPLLDTLGVSAPYGSVTITDGAEAHVALAVPSAAGLTSAICSPVTAIKDGKHGDSTATIVGHVYDARSRAPVASTKIVLVWQALAFDGRGVRRVTRQLHAVTKEDGWFALCGLDGGDYELRAENGARKTGYVDVALQPREIARSSLQLGSESGVAARISGKVTARDGRALEGAKVTVDGSSSTAVTDARGVFSLSGLPSGSRMMEARVLGYDPTRTPIAPSVDEPTEVTVVMEKHVETLKEVTVFGKESAQSRDLSGFAERSRLGFGHFITPEKIARTMSPNICDLLREVPGLGVTVDTNLECDVSTRGVHSLDLCGLMPYRNGHKFSGTMREFTRSMSPRDIVGIEVYTQATEPPQFPGGCGSLVVWTH